MTELLSLIGAITAGFYFVMLVTPFAAGKLKAPHAWWIFWAGLLSGTMCVMFFRTLRCRWCFFAWLGLMIWAGVDVQIRMAKRIDGPSEAKLFNQ